jgi:hypothetical protein
MMTRLPRFVAGMSLASAIVAQRSEAQPQIEPTPHIHNEDHHDTSRPLREIVPFAPETPAQGRLPQPLKVLPWRRGRPPIRSSSPDSVLQAGAAGPLVTAINPVGFDGLASQQVHPPDSNASVGATQIVETVNSAYQVFDKSGTSLLGPANLNTIWANFGGVCQTGPNFSDPIVLYDKLAGRWLISQIASANGFGSGTECIAVSTTSDATGGYNRYAYAFNNLNDYPKFGVWPDAYYASYNMFTGNTFNGAQVCAYPRGAMLAGNAAPAVCFQRQPADFSFLPSDLDGFNPPPTGEPNFYLELATATSLNLFTFHVDFATPANSTFTGPTAISVSAYTEPTANIPQAGTTQQLDSLGDRLMHRLAYRNLGDHESLVVNHSVVAGSTVGIRWYEIRSPNGTPTVFQQGTYAPDNNNFRWMGSIAMDGWGNIALGYSVSSGTIFPDIRFTGRVVPDPLGTMETEGTLVAGRGSQTGSGRWGDYTSMAIDPTDDATFVYTNQYLLATGNTWTTRVSTFRLGPPVPAAIISVVNILLQ